MRSSPVKIEKKPAKLAAKKAHSIKKKKLVDMKPPIRDTISETISFVIKGKLTPIKPILIDNKFEILGRTNKKLHTCGKIIKKKASKIGQKPVKQMSKKSKQKSKPKTKVQSETAKKPSAQNSIKKSAEKIIPDVISNTPKEVTKKPTKTDGPSKMTKSKIVAKTLKVKKPEVLSKPVKPKVKKETAKKPKKKPEEPNQKETDDVRQADEIKKQQTIEELLKQVNEELIENKKTKKQKIKARKECGDITKEKTAKKVKESDPVVKKVITKKPCDKKIELPVPEPEKDVATEIPDEITLKELSQIEKPATPSSKIKTEPISDEEVELKPTKKPYKKIKTEPKMTIMKKRVISKNKDQNALQKCTTKLFGFWNGPKRHRVASLNALAKVHCLYENETRGNILDVIEESSKAEYLHKRDGTRTRSDAIKTEDSDDTDRASSPLPTRTLRSVPGLRGMGKHWDMHDSSSSSEETSDEDNSKSMPLKEIKKEKPARPVKERESEKTKQERKRNRKQSELMMDLKDMVVRKRMASLNASAILAASYSVERRQTKAVKSDGDSSDSYDGSSEEYFAASDNEIKLEDDVKKEDDRKLIEVHTTPNKKVAVILNQDTDVTITGVYVNSTTRSTHHEGYCSIAGMQYRISATSHTQTAATAVATETLLQSSSNSAPDNSNSDSLPSSKSYTPLDALSNMQPPPGPGIQHNHPVIQQPHMGPPQHVLPMPAHQLSPGLRHSCSSAFSSPHSTPTYQLPPGHHPPEPGYVHAGYYQPAGPLITVPHGGHAPPPPAPLSKSAPLSESSPTSTTPSLSGHETTQAPTSNRDGGDSSDSEVIITSVTTAKDPTPLPPPPPHPSYRYAQYPPTPPGYSYPHYSYHYPTPPPSSYGHHELCYSYKYPYNRRYLAQYYPAAGVQEVYPPSGQSQQSQQVVPTPAPATSNPSGGAPFASAAPPPPPIMDPYPPPPQPTLVEPYQPAHYYPPPAFGPPPPPPTQCYGHAGSTRGIPYINATYQSCPCPMQSCPKNVLTGPLTGDSKRSNIASISKDSMPLPPVALALPLEPASETGPPSPARGSAGMPPPPSPAGATYQPPPPPTKQESQPTLTSEDCKKRKARIGKAMVRNNIAAGMQNGQHNTMLLMCNPTQNFVSAVKREIESPKEKEIVEEKKEDCSSDEEVKPTSESLQVSLTKPEDLIVEQPIEPVIEPKEEKLTEDAEEELDKENAVCIEDDVIVNEVLPPVISTVAENVKVKNMKRKLSLTKEKVPEPDVVPPPTKKQKLSSYKMLIKKDTNSIKINNGKRKLIEDPPEAVQTKRSTSKSKKPTKRKLSVTKEETSKRLKVAKPLVDSNKQPSKGKSEVKVEDGAKKVTKKVPVNSKVTKSAPAVLDNLITKNSIDRTIDSVICEVTTTRTSKELSALKTAVSKKTSKDLSLTLVNNNNNNNNNNKKSTNKNVQKVVKSECKKPLAAVSKRKTKSVEVVPQPIMKVPRRSLHLPRWSNGWRWEGESYDAKVFINSDEMTVVRRCYPAMMHETGDKIVLRDCVLLKAGPRKNDLPFVAKIAALWENPDDGEMMMSLLWYYRPEHTEQGRLPSDQPDEVFASRHKDSNSVACIDDKCYVLTFNEYCRYRKRFKRMEEGIEETLPCIPNPEPYPRIHRQPPSSQISPEMVFFCRRVYDFRQKRIMKNPT